jgi:hypothetical protein
MSRERFAWTIVHGFYGSMGGFVVEREAVPIELGNELFGKRQRLTLTARGAALVARCGHLPHITREEILDKNKADTIAKLFVCLQAGWFFIQVFARLANRLPVTLLEVNTLGHVAIAFVMYMLWWHKPRQVKEPTKLEGEWLPPLLAYMYMASHVSGRKHRKLPFHSCPDDAEIGGVVYRLNQILPPGSGDYIGKMSRGEPATALSGYFHKSRLGYLLAADLEGTAQYTHWISAAKAIETYPVVSEGLRCLTHDRKGCSACNGFRLPMEELLVPTTADYPNDELLRRVNSLVMGVILWGATIVYGAIHTAAWNAYFPTTIEKWMWHSSSVWVAFSGVVWVSINAVAKLIPQIDRLWMRFLRRKTHWLFDAVVLLLCVVCGVAYIFSRGFLVIEAFISLRRLPVAAYETPSWLQVLPHL